MRELSRSVTKCVSNRDRLQTRAHPYNAMRTNARQRREWSAHTGIAMQHSAMETKCERHAARSIASEACKVNERQENAMQHN
eukprot:9500704-Pyramimonas_sp.AAC.1